eukprot:CAMPEP_0174331162 /NCGR_PEP_ID=MMETSP0810-20121108/17270_1 /TAXON_ID=73025 ORGANISM="Eutreptiella gymnastica-like, Strain CCMP1594" /NCGR_SAMPLE_ID=MMETSP0810 /ASSEMBLY_ACC=CAM_ASM_000659 /LENGTH=81 /DNA_ID=CAMNT_0015446791 /DNA_START=291 /DNA_END=536 /DNA_ORIENTATION=+
MAARSGYRCQVSGTSELLGPQPGDLCDPEGGGHATPGPDTHEQRATHTSPNELPRHFRCERPTIGPWHCRSKGTGSGMSQA